MIANPRSGTDRAPGFLPLINDRLRAFFDDLDITITAGEADIERAATRAVEEGCSLLFVAGGDGTLNVAVRAVAAIDGALERITFGVIPAGTGNDFAKALDLGEAAEAALDLLMERDVILVKRTTTLEFVALLQKIASGQHAGDERIVIFRTADLGLVFDRTVHVNADGEVLAAERCEYRLLRRAARSSAGRSRTRPRRLVPSWSNDRVDRPRIGISRCLLGDEVRYDGGHKRDAFLVDTLGQDVEWVAVCPEVEMNMGTPREPIQLVEAADGLPSGEHRVRLLGVDSGRDWTSTMDTWRRDRLRELAAAGLSGYVLKSGSPSCGMDGVPVHAGGGPARTGRGLFAQALIDAMPGLPVEDDQRLHDPRLRAAFIARVFDHHRMHSCLRNRA